MTLSLLMAGGAPISQTPAIKPHFATVTLETGVTLHYLEQGDPQGEPVIMLHGYTDSWNSYAPVLPLLSPAYHVFALDQRGHGESSKTATDFTVERIVADVVAFMDAQGIAKATVVGHSLGSMVAQLVAIRHPDRGKKARLDWLDDRLRQPWRAGIQRGGADVDRSHRPSLCP